MPGQLVSIGMALDSDSFLPDAGDRAETWRQMRWHEGLYCPECGSDQVQTRQENYRDHLHRHYCKACGNWFIDTTGTFLEASNVSLRRWVYFAREMDKGRASGTSLRADRRRDWRDEKDCAAHSSGVPEGPPRPARRGAELAGEVEADDVHVKGGQQGREVSEQEGSRMARMRGLSERGRGTYAGDRPLVGSWGERGGNGRVFELRRSAGKKSLLSSALSHVENGREVETSHEGEGTSFWAPFTNIGA